MGIKIIANEKPEKTTTGFDLSKALTKEITFFGGVFNNKKKETWYAELNVLLCSGIDLKHALELLAETRKTGREKELMQLLLQKLVEGSPFSEIIKDHKAFSDYEYHAIKIGEQTGQLGQITLELSQFYKRKNDLRQEIISAMTYPVIVLITAIIVIIFMLKYVVPMFVDIFEQNNVDLPAITKVIIGFSGFVQAHGWLLLLGMGTMVMGIAAAARQEWFTKIWGYMQLKIPIIGNYFRQIYMAQFTQALALLTAAKVPMVDSIDLVKNMINFYPLQEGLTQTNLEVIAGEKLSASFSNQAIFDKKMIAMVRVAEETNQTEFVFQKLSEQYNQQVQYQSRIIANVLNPILTLLVGAIVGIVLVAMYLPMFKLSSVIG